MLRLAMNRDGSLLLLDKDQVELLLDRDQVLGAVREAFILHSKDQGRIFPVVREQLAGGNIFGIKSGEVPGRDLLGFKAAGFWPANRRAGGEPHQATILLFDPNSGRPLCVIDGNAITALRTGAAGGLGLLALARSDSARVCVFGTGVQARSQLAFALELVPSLREVHYVTSSGASDRGFETAFAGRCAIFHAPDGNAAVAASDVVITATPSTTALFESDAVQGGTHINCVGADTKGKRELPLGLLERARLFVDDRVQARQIGESQWMPDRPCIEFGDLIGSKVQIKRESADITIFDMTGLALQDLMVARGLHERAVARGVGSRIAWPW
jgi:alanine dehydrogenase